MAAPRGGTRERILDAAEKIFAARGYDGTSTRAIVAASGDTIGSVSYHFGSKEKLFREVVQRRFDIIADARRARYREAEARAGAEGPTLEAVVDAIATPYMDRALRGGKAWRSYTHLISSLVSSPKLFHKTWGDLGERTAREFMGWLARALPEADAGDIAFTYEFMIGCIIEACMESEVDRISSFTNGRWSAKDFESVTPRLIRFITAGITAVVSAKSDARRPAQPAAARS